MLSWWCFLKRSLCYVTVDDYRSISTVSKAQCLVIGKYETTVFVIVLFTYDWVALFVLQCYIIISLVYFFFFPQNFCVRGLELFSSYLFKDILELYDWNLKGNFYLGKKKHTKFELVAAFVNRTLFCDVLCFKKKKWGLASKEQS